MAHAEQLDLHQLRSCFDDADIDEIAAGDGCPHAGARPFDDNGEMLITDVELCRRRADTDVAPCPRDVRRLWRPELRAGRQRRPQSMYMAEQGIARRRAE